MTTPWAYAILILMLGFLFLWLAANAMQTNYNPYVEGRVIIPEPNNLLRREEE